MLSVMTESKCIHKLVGNDIFWIFDFDKKPGGGAGGGMTAKRVQLESWSRAYIS